MPVPSIRKTVTRFLAAMLIAPVLLAAACSAPAPARPTPTLAATPAALEERLNQSFFLTLDLARHALPSYHIAIAGTRPLWNPQANAVEPQTINLQVDVAGSDLYLLENMQQGGQTTAKEGFIIGGGPASSSPGKEFEKLAGKLAASTAISTRWAALPREIGLPLFIAAAGSRLAGEETLDGRQVDRYEMNSANAPAGTTRELGRTVSIRQASGTLWLDRQSGALLKMVLDYEQNILDPATSRDVLGQGLGHFELRVTRIGNVQVALP
jgi:hypothetical protein